MVLTTRLYYHVRPFRPKQVALFHYYGHKSPPHQLTLHPYIPALATRDSACVAECMIIRIRM
jgi:hypothetical protein